jgi:hypothetical protein
MLYNNPKNMKLANKLRELPKRIRSNPRQSLVIGLLLALASVPIITMIHLLVRYSVNVPFWDQWDTVFLVHKMHAGNLNIHDLWMQHNEHRILFPRLVMLGLSLVTNFNLRYEVLLNLVIASLTYGMVLLMVRRTFGGLTQGTAGLAFLFAWLLYSPLAWINWIWGFQLCFFMGVLFSVITIWMLTKAGSKSYQRLFYLSLVTGTIGTYCVGNGLVIWGVGLILLLLQKVDRRKIWIWIGTAAVVSASYLYHFHRSPDSLPLRLVAKEPVAVFKYFLSYLGRNLAWTPTGGRYTGFALLVLLLTGLYVIYKKGQFAKILNWLGLALYVGFSAFIAAVSRLNFGVDQSFADSYVTMSVLFVIATIAVSCYAGLLLLKNANKRRYQASTVAALFVGALCVPLVTSFIHNYSYGVGQLEGQSRDFLKVQRCVYSARSAHDPCLLYLYPEKPTAWRGIQDLKQLKWGDFGEH